MSLDTLIQGILLGAYQQNAVFSQARLTELRQWLATLPELRVLVAATPGMGHQSNTIAILRRLISYGFAGQVLVVYDVDTGNPRSVLDKLAALLPGFRPDNVQPYVLDGVTLNFAPLATVSPATYVPLGITGGWDTGDYTTILAKLKVGNFIRLEPYRWSVKSALWDSEGSHYFSDSQILGGAGFDQRAFFAPTPGLTDAQWDQLFETNGVDPEMLHMAEMIDGYLQLDSDKPINFLPVYGIGDKPSLTTLCSQASEILFNIVAGAAYAQSNSNNPMTQRPLVIAVVADIKDSSWTDFTNYVGGNVPQTWAQAANYIAGAQLPRRVTVQSTVDAQLLDQTIQNMGNDDILVVTLPKPPPLLFNYLYAVATFPPVFEGLTTANLMLNLGQPYIHLAKASAIVYPELVLGTHVGPMVTALTQTMQSATAFMASWPANPNDAPAYKLGTFILAGEDLNSPVSQYFQQVRAFYHAEQNDKLLMAMLFTMPRLLAWTPPQAPRALTLVAPAPAAAFDLQALYQQLKAAVSGGDLSLAQVLGTDQIAAFLASVFGTQGLTIAGVQIDFPDPPGTAITLTGNADALGVPGIGISLVFSLSEDGSSLAADLSLTTGAFSFPGAPWFKLARTSATASLADNGASVGGAIAGTIAVGGTELDVSFAYPGAPDVMLLSGAFAQAPPTIGSVFALLGGINFVNALPPQLQGLASIALDSCALQYDFAAGRVTSFNVVLATTVDWPLFGKLKIDKGMSVRVVVGDPTADRSVSWIGAGSLAIGPGSLDVGIVYPDLTVTALLAEGSAPIPLADLITFFLPPDVQAPIAGDLSALSLTIAPGPPTTYDVSATMDLDWPIPANQPVFTIENIGFAIADGGGGASGMFTGTLLILPNSAKIELVLTATYAAATGWVFDGQQTGGVVSLGDLLQAYLGWDTGGTMGIDGLGLTIATKDDSWTFTGKTAAPWTIPFLGISISASLRAGWAPAAAIVATLPVMARSTIPEALERRDAQAARGDLALVQADGGGYFGRVEAEIVWQNIDLKVFYDYAPGKTSFGITWGILQGLVSGPDANGDYTATLRFTEGTTLGSIIETMVSWATGSKFSLASPWDALDTIPLGNLALVYTFNPNDDTRNKVSIQVDIGPIELGFARIDSIGIGYQSTGPDAGVNVALNGSFRWQDDPSQPLGWDATRPETTPAPPGNGNKYVDLRLLAMGQHVTVKGLADAKTIEDAIALMRDFPDPQPGEIPPVLFDAGSDWLVGMDFGLLKIEGGGGGNGALDAHLPAPTGRPLPVGSTVPGTALVAANDDDDDGGYVVSLQIVFNDPVLYGLRIALAGDAAKILKGLEFEIMYRQVSPTVGVYQAEITLPDAMRYLSIGAYSLTLPVFAIQVYTNGDFLIDVGFPWNQDFSRSFSIEAIIPPGIPMLGSAGLYFGKLSSATTSKVPQATNGTFNPVIVFGFGMQVGFGKSIRYGILSAGFSVTVFGIIEGVIAKWNPYQITDGGVQPRSQVQGSYYFWLQGTVGVIGKVFGSIDFAIIKADVDITVKLMLQLTYESYVAVTITVCASVSVSVSVKINLGLFKITIHFSFSMQLRESFRIDASGTPPWQVAGPPGVHALRQAALRRAALQPMLMTGTASVPNWSNLVAGTAAPLTGYLVPGLTVARDEWGSASLADQVPCAVALLVIQSVPPAGGDGADNRAKAAGDATDTSFELLAKMVLRWAVAAMQGGPVTSAQVDAVQVDLDLLDRLANDVLVSKDADPTPLTPAAIDAFLAGQFSLSVSVPDSTVADAVDATCFPMAPSVSLDAPAYGGGYPGYAYGFGGYNALDADALSKLRAYFDQLAVKVQQEMAPAPKLAAEAADQPLSVAGWVFSDYFLLIARQMVKAAQDALHNLEYPIATGDTPGGVVDWVNTQGQLGGEIAFTLTELFVANAAHPLNASKPLAIGVAAAPAGGASFEALATRAMAPLTGTQLALANAALAGALATGQSVTYAGTAYTVAAGDTLVGIAGHFQAKLSDLLAGSDMLTAAGLPSTAASLLYPLLTVTAAATDSFQTIAAQSVWGGAFDATALATANAGNPVLRAGARITYPGQDPHVVAPLETLGDVANALGVTLAQLLANGDVLEGAGVLTPAAQMFVPAFICQTVAGDSLQGLAGRFGVSLALLAAGAGNGGVVDLFDAATPTLSIPGLVQFPLGALIADAQRAGALQHLSGMVSRYMMHGMRLPTDGITPLQPGLWVRGTAPSLSLPPQAGLYALTGQQVPLPTLDGTNAFTLTLTNAGGASWLDFSGGALVLSFVPGADLAKRAAAIATYAQSTKLAVPVTALGGGAMDHAGPASYPFSAATAWQAAGPVTMPYGPPPAGVEALRIWRLPDAMASLPDPARRRTDPCFALMTATYDPASGRTVQAAVDSYGWASTIGFTVKRIDAGATPPSSPAAAGAVTYEIVGAGGNDIALLERLVAQVGADDGRFASVTIAFAPENANGASPGLASDSGATLTFGISQVNLSTETHPPRGVGLGSLAAAAPAPLGLLNKPSDFVRLLWEASITASGGFYLYYFDAGSGRGLPDRLFNDRQEAQLTLLLLFDDAAGKARQVANFMNAAVTAAPIAGAAVFALADPQPVTLTASATDTLAGLAQGWFDDAGAVAAVNAGVTLAPVTLTVAQGVVQAPAGGIALAALASAYGTDVAALNAANPVYGGGLPDPLPFPAAVRLPVLTLTCGTSPHSATLQQVADFYGEPLGALAADNADLPGLFAGQTITVNGGPNTRAATVAAGVQAVAAGRPAPPAIPDSPDDAGFALDYLLNAFQLLGQRVLANPGFIASNDGLPAGPTVAPPQQTGKFLAAVAEADVEDWSYSASLPYYRFAATKNAQALTALPDPLLNPYRGVGRLLQLWFDWQDQYGNRLITTLSDPDPGQAGPPNAAPIATGYSDPIIALGQWPSVRASWELTRQGSAAAIQLALAFDPTRYQGLLKAAPSDPSTIVATFTDPVSAAGAIDVTLYQMLPDKPQISSATVSNDGLTVTLALATPLGEAGLHTLIVGDLPRAGAGPSLGGQAQFTVPDDPAQRNSSLVQAARTALATLSALYYQITDPNGFAFAVETTLLAGQGDAPGSVAVPQSDVDALTAWLFSDADSIFAYLADRAQFGTTVAPPSGDLDIAVPLSGQTLNPGQIFELWLSLGMARTGGAVIAGLETTSGIASAATRIAPLQSGGGGTTLGLAAFATALETALSSATQLVKVAIGTNRTTSDAGAATALWLVRLGLDAADPISFAPVVGDGTPTIFAPAPVSNQLQSRQAVPIYDYSSQTGISTTSRPVDFSDIDVDGWCEQIFGWIDELLSPLFTAPIQILGKWDSQDYLQTALDAKEKIAAIAAQWMMPVFTDPGALYDQAAARETFRQQLLSRLSNAYSTRAAIQYAMAVKADVGEAIAPRLFGPVGGPRPAFLWASVGTDRTILTLTFSDPLAAAPATTAGNYTLPGGIAVMTATLSGAVVTLALSKAVPAQGRTDVTVQNLTDADGRPLVGVLARQVMAGAYLPPAISLTAPKLDLADASAAPLTFLVSAPGTVHADGGGVAKSIPLDLIYQGSQIEHQISDVAAIPGYQASSWLSFVVPMDQQAATNPLIVPLTRGQPLDVPMVLRAFPPTPTMDKQEGDPSFALATADLEQMLLWDYQLGYSLPYHYPQDRISGTVQFNLGQSGAELAGMLDAFAALAEFVTVYPKVHDDLLANLAPIDATTDPGSTGVATARIALGAFLQLVGDIAGEGSGYFGVKQPPRPLKGAAPLTFDFDIAESAMTINGASALLVTITGALPDGMTQPPAVLIDADVYTAVPPPDVVPVAGSYPYVYRKADGTYLDDLTGQAIRGRTLLLPQLDILQRQDALGEIQLERNVDLVEGKTTADPFVYTTASVTFANPLFPTNDSDGVVDVSKIGSTAVPPAPVTRSLPAHLEALFAAILARNVQTVLTIQIEARYTYPLNDALSGVELPVLFQPPVSAPLSGSGDVPIPETMIAALAEAIGGWFAARMPRGDGTLTFDLVVMSNETVQPMPLLRLRDLVLPIAFVSPPLAVNTSAPAGAPVG